MRTKYGVIAGELRETILNGEQRPGSTLPPIPELMTRYGVARDTIRDAIGVLVSEGLVTPRRGIGTVVRDTSRVELAYRPQAPARVWSAQTGQAGSDQVVAAGSEPADAEVAERLGIEVGSPTVHRVRHQRRGDDVAQVHEQWVPADLVNAIQAATGTNLGEVGDGDPGNLFEQLREAGFGAVLDATETISTRMPDFEERELLALPQGVPVLVTNRVTVDVATDRRVETSTMVGAGDRMSQSFTVRVLG